MNFPPRKNLYHFRGSRGMATVSDLLDWMRAISAVLPFDVHSPEQIGSREKRAGR